MSVKRWAYIPEKCEGDNCPGNCDECFKQDECPPNVTEDECLCMNGDCESCWKTFGAVEPPKEEECLAKSEKDVFSWLQQEVKTDDN